MSGYSDLSKERNFRLNKPEYEPGQGSDSYSKDFGMSDDVDWASLYGDASGNPEAYGQSAPQIGSVYTPSTGGYNTGSSLSTGLEYGYGNYGTAQGNYGMSQYGSQYGSTYGNQDNSQLQNMSAKERLENTAYELSEQSLKNSWDFLKKLKESTKTQTKKGYREYFSKLFIYGIGAMVLAVVFSGVLRFTGWNYAPPGGLLFAGPVVAGVGLVRRMSKKYYDAPEDFQDPKYPGGTELVEPIVEEDMVFAGEDLFAGSGFGDGSDDLEEEGWGTGSDSAGLDESWGDDGGFDDFFSQGTEEEEEVESTPVEGNEEGQELNFTTLDSGLHTRKMLVDLMKEGMPTYNPNFSETKELDPESSEFLGYYDKVKEAAEAANVPYDNQPVLEAAWESIFTTTLKCRVETVAQSVNGMINHLENLLKYNDMGQVVNENVQVTGHTVGKNVFFTLIWNKAKLLYHGDMLRVDDVYNKWTDSGNLLPATWGVDEKGNSFTTDFNSVVSMIVSGPPESGKTEFVVRLLAGMMWVASPKDVNFLFASPKALEDYGIFKDLPHVKGFETNPEKIVDMLDWVITVEAERRKALINKYGYNNAKNFNKSLPEGEKPIPVLWVVLDEMASIQALLPKERVREYISNMTTVATQFRSVNIKLVMMPHRITNSMIPKDVYSIADVRAMFRATEDALKEGIGVTARDFPYKLNHRGDYALKHKDINNGEAKYLYTPILTLGSKTKIIEDILNIWGRLEPDEKPSDWETTMNGGRASVTYEGFTEAMNPKENLTGGYQLPGGAGTVGALSGVPTNPYQTSNPMGMLTADESAQAINTSLDMELDLSSNSSGQGNPYQTANPYSGTAEPAVVGGVEGYYTQPVEQENSGYGTPNTEEVATVDVDDDTSTDEGWGSLIGTGSGGGGSWMDGWDDEEDDEGESGTVSGAFSQGEDSIWLEEGTSDLDSDQSFWGNGSGEPGTSLSEEDFWKSMRDS